MAWHLQDIPRVKTITKQDFIKQYFKPQKPVVIEQFVNHWQAFLHQMEFRLYENHCW